jgi:hypothetical protein
MDADIQTSVCTFTLDSFKISDTRSLHKDTVYVSIAVAVGSNPAITLPTKSMGDLNNGTYSINLSIPNVEVSAAEKVAFSYSIIKYGHDKDAIEQTLQKVVAGGCIEGRVIRGRRCRRSCRWSIGVWTCTCRYTGRGMGTRQTGRDRLCELRRHCRGRRPRFHGHSACPLDR